MQPDAGKEALARLLGFLDTDPGNPELLRDAAQAALQADEVHKAVELSTRLEATGRAEAGDRNLAAIAAMRAGDAGRAVELFQALLRDGSGDPALKFNLAWAHALNQDFPAAREALDEEVLAALPQAAMLEMQLLHDAGELDSAAARARGHLARHPDYPPLLAAISVLALDMEDDELARDCASKAGDHPDALTTLGTLALTDGGDEAARPMFQKALAVNDRSPRAWVGLGLANLAAGDHANAASQLDKGAELFGDHLGSWIAAGWAYLVAGDRAGARARFERALQIDPNFAESHGSLAVLDMLEGETAAAERRIEVALRLDRQCFAAAFASMLKAQSDGDAQSAQRIMELALDQPIDEKGGTLGDMLGRLAR